MPAASALPTRAVASASGNLRSTVMNYAALAKRIRDWGRELGFQAVGIADADLSAAEPRLLEWLAQGRHGEMEYMARHGALRARPGGLKPGTGRVISCRLDYAIGDGGATQAIVAPYELDARRCISYLTIEHKSAIPEELRPLIGNRVYGCDDCQLVCPWNRFAQPSSEADFQPRHGLERATMIELFRWTEAQFGERLARSPVPGTGH